MSATFVTIQGHWSKTKGLDQANYCFRTLVCAILVKPNLLLKGGISAIN